MFLKVNSIQIAIHKIPMGKLNKADLRKEKLQKYNKNCIGR